MKSGHGAESMAFRLCFLTSEGHSPYFQPFLKAIPTGTSVLSRFAPTDAGVSACPQEQSSRHVRLREARGPHVFNRGR